MTYFPDLSPYDYSSLIGGNAKNIGWLDSEVSFPKANPEHLFLDCLWKISHYSVFATRGCHYCNLCQPKWFDLTCESGENLVLGTAEIIVFGREGSIYLAPNLLFHYVSRHYYDPPPVFKDAVIENASLPNDCYIKKIEAVGVPWEMTPDN